MTTAMVTAGVTTAATTMTATETAAATATTTTTTAAADDCGSGLWRWRAGVVCGGVRRQRREVEQKQWPGVMIMITFRSEDLLFSCALRTAHWTLCPPVVNVLFQL